MTLSDLTAIATALAPDPVYLVGGAVRDFVLGAPAHDFDLATSAHPETVADRLAIRFSGGGDIKINMVGAAFGVVLLTTETDTYEIATFRGDVYDGETRKPEVTYTDTIEEDLARRDFTINAMAIDLRDTRIIDPFGGQKDLKDGVLRTPGDTRQSFRDDPLRMLRAARFLARFNLLPAVSLKTVAYQEREQLAIVSTERITDELCKLLQVVDPSAGFEFLSTTYLSDEFFPELNRLRMEDIGASSYKEVFTHTLAVIRNTDHSNLRLRLSALFHDISKPETFAKNGKKVSFHQHEVVGADRTREIMTRMKFPKQLTDDVVQLVRLHLRSHTSDNWTDSAVRRYIRDAGHLLTDLNALQRADVTTRNPHKAALLSAKMDEVERRIAEVQAIDGAEVIKPPLDGRQIMDILGIAPGPQIGVLLNGLLEARLDNGPMTEDEAIALLHQLAKEAT